MERMVRGLAAEQNIVRVKKGLKEEKLLYRNKL